MKYECDVIRDLMPLAADGMASEASKNAIAAHIKACGTCEREWNTMRGSVTVYDSAAVPEETKQYAKTAKRLKNRRMTIGAVCTLLVLLALSWAVFFSPFADGSAALSPERAAVGYMDGHYRYTLSGIPKYFGTEVFYKEDKSLAIVLDFAEARSGDYMDFWVMGVRRNAVGIWSAVGSTLQSPFYRRGGTFPETLFDSYGGASYDDKNREIYSVMFYYAFAENPEAKKMILKVAGKEYTADFRDSRFAGVFVPYSTNTQQPDSGEILDAAGNVLYRLRRDSDTRGTKLIWSAVT